MGRQLLNKNKDSEVWKIICLFFIFALLVDVVLSGEIIQLNLKQSAHNLQNHDTLKHDRYKRNVVSFAEQRKNLEGKPGQGYYVEVQIGTPPQKLNVLVDTGSSNFAVAASYHQDVDIYFHRDKSSTYHELGTKVHVPYTQGKWDGILGTDLVALTSISNVKVRSDLAFITDSSGFFINGSNWQGILGMAYASIAQPSSSVLPFFDSLVSEADVDNIFSVQLCGTLFETKNTSEVEMGGSLTLGGKDATLYTGDLFYTAINKEWYYEIVLVDIQVDGQSLNMDCKEYNFPKTIVDSGTTNLRLPSKVFNKVKDRVKSYVKQNIFEMPGERFWIGEDHICWNEGQIPYSDFPKITITLPLSKNSSFKLDLSPQQYIRPVGEENDDKPGVDCFKFAVSSSVSGSVLGAVVMEGYYVVFDRRNKKIGFAESNCPVRDKKAFKSTVIGPLKYTGNASDCAYFKVQEEDKTLTIVAYVMTAICCICLLPLVMMIIQWQWHRCACRRLKRQNSDSNDLISDSR